MGKKKQFTTIQVTPSFRDILRKKKREKETYEQYIRRWVP